MKKTLTVALLAASAFGAYAAHVDADRAMDIAVTYAQAQVGVPATLSVKSVETMKGNLYLVHFAPKGFAIISSDDNAAPVIGYSFESNLDANALPENMEYIMQEASDLVHNKSINGSLDGRWRKIESGYAAQSRSGEPVEPLIQVKWNQPSPFNKYCPGEGNNKAVVGCVAVAMSQAMSVQRYPAKPQGQMSYNAPNYGNITIDYDKEDAYDWDAILKGSNNYDEVARLLYHAGVSVKMDYGPDGSGIPSNQVYRISNALKEHFGYPDDVKYYWRADYSGNWEQLLLNELWAGRAIVYNAIDTKGGYGHSFNIDGYNGDQYHLNWGWGGYGNGYFSIDDLADAQMGMNYNANHVAVVGIGGADSPLKSITLSDNSIESGLPVGSPVAMVRVNGEKPNASDVKIEVTGEYDRFTGNFKDVPLKYEKGMLVTTSALTTADGPIGLRVVATALDGSKAKLTQGFSLEVEEAKPLESKTSLSYDRASKTFTVHTRFNAEYVVKNASGAIVVQGKTDEDSDFDFSRDLLSKGANTLQVTYNGQTKTVTIKL